MLIESKQTEEEIDIDLEDPETEKAALKIQGAFKGLRSKRNAKAAAQSPVEGVCVHYIHVILPDAAHAVPFVRLSSKQSSHCLIMHCSRAFGVILYLDDGVLDGDKVKQNKSKIEN